MKLRPKTVALVLMCAAVVIWGLSFPSTKAALAVFQPMTLALLRFVIGCAVLYPIKRKLAPDDRLVLRDVPAMAGAGIFGVTLYFLCENYGIKLTTASESALIVAIIPAMILIAESVLTRRRRLPSPAQGLGAVLSFVGVALLVHNGFRLSGSTAGYLFMLGADVAWVVYTFLTNGLFGRYQRISIVYWQSVFGLVGLVPFAAAESSAFTMPSLAGCLNLAYLAVACTALGYWFYTWALEFLGAVTTTMFINLIPVVAVVAGAMLGERLSGLQMLGGTLAVGGVFVSSIRARTATKTATKAA
jgi:drug/metabolite transporter (DMT)-like permease